MSKQAVEKYIYDDEEIYNIKETNNRKLMRKKALARKRKLEKQRKMIFRKKLTLSIMTIFVLFGSLSLALGDFMASGKL